LQGEPLLGIKDDRRVAHPVEFKLTPAIDICVDCRLELFLLSIDDWELTTMY
jgi:hypothetical protein